MKSRVVAVVLGVALSVFGWGTAAAVDRVLSTEVKLEPMAKPGVYQATVEIRDVSTQEVVAAPILAFLKGEPVSTKTTLDSGEEVLFTIQVEAAGATASYSAEVRNGGRTLALQKASIALSR